MKILIIGSDGFIGSHCVNYFKAKKAEIWTASLRSHRQERHTQLTASNTYFETLFKQQTYDFCINASGSAQVGFSFENPNHDFELNVLNINKILVAIRNFQPQCRLINFSSAAVYGNPQYLPIQENAPKQPLSPYGFHKLQSEYLLTEYHTFFGLKTCSLRVFSAYGNGLRKQLFWDLFQKMTQNQNLESITLFGTGNESRDFIHIQDLLLVIDTVMQKSAFEGECLNVAAGIEVKISEAVDFFKMFLNPKIKIIFTGNNKIGDPLNWHADISRLHSLGFSPQITLKEGIEAYIQWLKEQR